MEKRILLLMEMTHSYTLEILRGVSRFAHEQGDWVLFPIEQGSVHHLPDCVKTWKGDGIIVRSSNAHVHRQLVAKEIPLVELLGDEETGFSNVLSDEQQVGKMAADHFLERGIRHLAWFSFGQTWWSKRFQQHYFENAQKEHCTCFSSPFSTLRAEVFSPPVMSPRQEQKIIQWLHGLPKPVGIFCPRDLNALFLLNLCKIIGLDVPNEISILGSGNNKILCLATTPTLSSIDTNGSQTGYQAAKLLHRMIQKKEIPPLPIWIPPANVITRQSTDTIAVNHPEFVAALRFLRENALIPLRIEDIAERVSVSQRTLLRWFRLYLRRSPKEEILRIRMEQAQTLLRETFLTIEQIGEQVGYPVSEHFIRAFRRYCHQTPGEYRLHDKYS